MNKKVYLIIDLERTIGSGIVHYWKPNKIGYTNYIADAGLYTYEKAKEIVESDIEEQTIMIKKEVASRIIEKV